jgi:RHS repeat-associated protein
MFAGRSIKGVDVNNTKPNVICPGGLQVNTYTGNLFLARTDLDIPARGIDLDFSFSYNSAETKYDYGYGGGWTHTFNVTYEKIGANISVKRWDGNRELFTGTGYTSPVGCFNVLTQYQPGKFLLTTKYGTEYYFDDSTHKKLTSISEPNGNTVTITYSGGYPTLITDASGRTLSLTWSGGRMTQLNDLISSPARTIYYQYNAKGNMTRVTDPLGDAINYEYDYIKRLVRMTDSRMNAFDVTYDDSSAVTRIQSTLSNDNFSYDRVSKITTHVIGATTTTYSFDSQGRVTDIAGACCGYHRQFQYDANNNIISQIDANGKTTTYTYDSRGNRLTETDPLLQTTTFTYESVYNQIASVTDKRGNITTYTYDSKANCTNISKPLGINLSYTYDSDGNNTGYTDGRGNATTIVYNGNDYPTSITHPIGSESFTYDNVGNVLSHTDANGNTTNNIYDSRNRLLTTSNALSEQTSYTYDANGNIASATYPDGNVINYTYNVHNKVTQVTDGIGTVQTNTYDDADNLISSIDGNGNMTTYTYDNRNRVTSKTMGGIFETYAYDAIGNMTTSTDGNGHSTTYTYDQLNRRISASIGGVTTSTVYDANNNVTQRTDGKGNSTTYTYDAMNRLTQETLPDASALHYTYDANSNTVSRTDNNGAVTSYIYDANNRLTKRDFPGSNDDNYTNDAGGRILTANNSDATISFTYDAANRRLTETMNAHTTSYSYNIAARQRSVTYPGGTVVQESRNVRERLISVSKGGVNVNFTYDGGSRLSAVTYGSILSTSYSYNSRDLVTALTHWKGSKLLAGYDYSYDNADNRTIASDIYDSTRSDVYSYNSTDWLTTVMKGKLFGSYIPSPVDTFLYSYDNAGNWTSMYQDGTTTYASNNLNQYTSRSPGGAFTYDPDGNMTASSTYSGTYDYENRLIYGASSIMLKNGYYKYDAFGRRIQKKASSDTINYYYDGNRIIEERNNTNTVTATYTYGGVWIDDILEMDRNGSSYYYVKDDLGSVVAVTDNTGDVVERYDYNPFGGTVIWDSSYTVQRTGSAIGNRFMFTGREYDAEVRLYNYRARHYDPAIGRFMQRDPIGSGGFNPNLQTRVYGEPVPGAEIFEEMVDDDPIFGGGDNRSPATGAWGDALNRGNGYVYVSNNPIRYLDPYGQATGCGVFNWCPRGFHCVQGRCIGDAPKDDDRFYLHGCYEGTYFIIQHPFHWRGFLRDIGLGWLLKDTQPRI